MQVAQVLAGYSLGEADLLRRAMGKKIRKEMQAQRERFVEGASSAASTQGQADAIFDLLERFADYGFNKSHAAAYALVAYQTAYLKANYPVEFLAASMTLDMGNTDKLAEFRRGERSASRSIRRRSIAPVVAFDVEGSTIIYALAALKGVGRQAVETIIAARGERPFADLADFAARVNPTRGQQARAGKSARRRRFRRIREEPRASARRGRCDAWPRAAARMTPRHRRRASCSARRRPRADYAAAARAWLPADRLRREYEAIGFFLSGHPLDDYAAALKRCRCRTGRSSAAR